MIDKIARCRERRKTVKYNFMHVQKTLRQSRKSREKDMTPTMQRKIGRVRKITYGI
jgi:AMMECR1 domain-containing protein